MDYKNAHLSRRARFKETCGKVDLLPTTPTMTQIKNVKGRKDKEGKGEVMLICCCFTNDPHQNYDPKVSQKFWII